MLVMMLELLELLKVTIAVGGVREVLLGTQDDADVLYLKKRRGFLHIAMDEKVGVVPVYAFNENQLFRHDSKAFLKFWENVNRYYKIGVPFMRGYFNLPMPYRKELLIAIGDPLFAKEGESIVEFQERYIQALKQLFDQYVSLSPDPKHKLIIT
jgi:1-acyl-sn-glycerol-3-phosphate acyltransferase